MNRNEIKSALERQVLSCMLGSPAESIPYICQRLKPADFTDGNRILFEALAGVDLTNINSPELLILKLFDRKLDGWALQDIAALAENSVSLDALVCNSILQRLLDVVFSYKAEALLKRSLEEAKETLRGLDILSDIAEQCNAEIARARSFKDEKPYSIKPVIDGIEAALSNKKITSYSSKGMPSFNNSTGGIMPANLIGIAGSYKSGKTTLALNLIFDFASQGIPCGFFSLEISAAELCLKLLAMLSGIEYEKLREPKKMSSGEKKILQSMYYKCAARADSLPLYVCDLRMTETEIKNKARYWRDRNGVKIIVVDYLGYIKSNKKFESRERELTYYSEFMKGLAKELGLAVIVVAQLNRSGKQNPATENLAESIGLARDCDFLFTIFNPVEIGIKKSKDFVYSDNHFAVRLDVSRHTKNRSGFVLALQDSGIFREIDTEFDNSFLKNGNEQLFPDGKTPVFGQYEMF